MLDSHFTETDVEMLNLNTEIVEDSEPIENMITDTTCEDEPEVVLDSEDEEMNCTGKVNVAKGFLEDKSSPVVNNYSVLSKKRLFRLPYEQANSTATTSVKSCTGMCLLSPFNIKSQFLVYLIILAYFFEYGVFVRHSCFDLPLYIINK